VTPAAMALESLKRVGVQHDGRPQSVWIVQRCLAHYRIPVFDRLDTRLRERGCQLKVVFDPDRLEGNPDTSRPYLSGTQPCIESRLLGVIRWSQPGLLECIRTERPVAVFVEGTPRMTASLRVPGTCRAIGAASFLWTKGHRELGRTGGPAIDLFRAAFAKRFSGIVCYAKSSRDDLIRIGVPAGRISVAPNAVDTTRVFERWAEFAAAAHDLVRREGLEGKRIILYCSTMYDKKRQGDLLDAWPALRDEFHDAVLVFVGGGEKLDEVRARAKMIDEKGIRVVGRVAEGVDYHWIGACAVSVMCGGLGLAIQQSLAFAKPMVVADEAGADGEIVEDGVTGWRYPRGDVAALASTIGGVLRDPLGATRIARQGQDRVKNEVNLDRMVDGFMSALENAGVIAARAEAK